MATLAKRSPEERILKLYQDVKAHIGSAFVDEQDFIAPSGRYFEPEIREFQVRQIRAMIDSCFVPLQLLRMDEQQKTENIQVRFRAVASFEEQLSTMLEHEKNSFKRHDIRTQLLRCEETWQRIKDEESAHVRTLKYQSEQAAIYQGFKRRLNVIERELGLFDNSIGDTLEKLGFTISRV